jgi:hypothetical protein
MEVLRAGSQPSGRGPADWFTGMRRIDALATTAMSHMAVQEKLSGSPADWLEHVTVEQ